MADTAVSISSLQSWKPTPIGRAGDDDDMAARSAFSFSMRDDASSRSASMSCVFTPGPMNPRPPARETATARAGPDMTRVGALIIMGLETHGYSDKRFLASCSGRDIVPSILNKHKLKYQMKKVEECVIFPFILIIVAGDVTRGNRAGIAEIMDLQFYSFQVHPILHLSDLVRKVSTGCNCASP